MLKTSCELKTPLWKRDYIIWNFIIIFNVENAPLKEFVKTTTAIIALSSSLSTVLQIAQTDSAMCEYTEKQDCFGINKCTANAVTEQSFFITGIAILVLYTREGQLHCQLVLKNKFVFMTSLMELCLSARMGSVIAHQTMLSNLITRIIITRQLLLPNKMF